jgi:KaiC/GvpD/RAD55 family RecA-like ATPase
MNDYAKELRDHPKYRHRFRAADEAARGGEPTPGEPAANDEKGGLDLVWADDIQLELDKAGLVDGLLPRDGMFVLYGESGSGKTFCVLDLVCHVAAGRPWRGMRVEQGVVVYVAAENPKSVERRLWAWRRRHGVQHLPVLVVRSSVDLLSGSADELVTLVEQVKARHGRVAAVVVDTLSRAMTGNENAPDDMGKFVNAVGRIGHAAEAHAIVVHHAGKDTARGARGHSSLRAASDVEGEVTVDAVTGVRTLRITKNRDGEDGLRFAFRLETAELGENAAGRMVTTCVAVETEAPAAEAKEPNLTAKQRTTLQCLATALADHGEDAPPAPDIPRNMKVARFARWQEAALRYLPGEGEEWRKRADFKRTTEKLKDKGLVRTVVVGGTCWCWLAKSAASQSGPARPSEGPREAPAHKSGCEGENQRAAQTSQTSQAVGCEGAQAETQEPCGFEAPTSQTSQTSQPSTCEVGRGSASTLATSQPSQGSLDPARLRGEGAASRANGEAEGWQA